MFIICIISLNMQRIYLTKIWYKLEKENVCLQNKTLCTAIHLKRFQIFYFECYCAPFPVCVELST